MSTGRCGAGPGLRVSVVVPTSRQPALLRRCLDALAMQRLAPAEFEILVVDDGHEEATASTVRDWALTHPRSEIRFLRPERGHGPAAARNCGWRAARAPLVAFTHDDTLPAPDWLAEGVQAMDTAPWVGCAGRIVVPPLIGDPDGSPTDHERMTQEVATADFAAANAFVRRSALVLVDGFDERFKGAWRDGSELQFRLQRDVGEVQRCHAAVVVKPVGAEPWGLSLRQQRHVYFEALLYREHPERYRATLNRQPRWHHHAIVAFSTAGLVLGLTGHSGTAGLFLLLALLGIGWLALERLQGKPRAPAHVAEIIITSALIPFLSVYWRWRGAWHYRVWFP